MAEKALKTTVGPRSKPIKALLVIEPITVLGSKVNFNPFRTSWPPNNIGVSDSSCVYVPELSAVARFPHVKSCVRHMAFVRKMPCVVASIK